jgi:hypothetical protein
MYTQSIIKQKQQTLKTTKQRSATQIEKTSKKNKRNQIGLLPRVDR